MLPLTAGLAMLWTFHAVLKRPLASPWRRRRSGGACAIREPFPFWPARRLARVASSLLAGIACHVFLDGFTHEARFSVLRSEALRLPSRLDRVSRPCMAFCSDVFSICMALLLLLQVAAVARKQRLDVFARRHGHPSLVQPSVCSLRWRFRLPAGRCLRKHGIPSIPDLRRFCASLAAARSAPPPVPCSSSSSSASRGSPAFGQGRRISPLLDPNWPIHQE